LILSNAFHVFCEASVLIAIFIAINTDAYFLLLFQQ